MDIEATENSIAVLIQLRDAYQSRLNARVIDELNAVINLLEAERDSGIKRYSANSEFRVLQVMAQVLQLVTNICELMK